MSGNNKYSEGLGRQFQRVVKGRAASASPIPSPEIKEDWEYEHHTVTQMKRWGFTVEDEADTGAVDLRVD